MCRVFSCVVGRGCLLWPVHSLGKTPLAFDLLHSVRQGQICLLLQVFLAFLLLHFSALFWRGHLFWVFVLEGLLGLHGDSEKLLSCVWLFSTPWTVAYQTLSSWDFPGKNTGVGCQFLLQEIFPTQGLNPGLPHCRLYHFTIWATREVKIFIEPT